MNGNWHELKKIHCAKPWEMIQLKETTDTMARDARSRTSSGARTCRNCGASVEGLYERTWEGVVMCDLCQAFLALGYAVELSGQINNLSREDVRGEAARMIAAAMEVLTGPEYVRPVLWEEEEERN